MNPESRVLINDHVNLFGENITNNTAVGRWCVVGPEANKETEINYTTYMSLYFDSVLRFGDKK